MDPTAFRYSIFVQLDPRLIVLNCLFVIIRQSQCARSKKVESKESIG
jgi:hypothetical protein